MSFTLLHDLLRWTLSFLIFLNVVPSALENLTVSVRQSTVDKPAIQPHTELTTRRDLAFVKHIIFKRSDVLPSPRSLELLHEFFVCWSARPSKVNTLVTDARQTKQLTHCDPGFHCSLSTLVTSTVPSLADPRQELRL